MSGKAKTRAAKPLRMCVAPPPVPGVQRAPLAIAVIESKLWRRPASGPVVLPVYFMDGPDAETRRKVMAAANRWYDKGVGVRFTETASADAPIRVARTRGQGYYSYPGTDALQVPRSAPTLNLDSFTANTSDAEYLRVVCHEFGHAIGCPHEHARPEIIARLDREKVYRFFGGPPNNWSRRTIDQQVLTPLQTTGMRGTVAAEEDSVMGYPFSAALTRDGRPIRGGSDITPTDAAFMSTVYPGSIAPPPPPAGVWTYQIDRATGAVTKVS